MPASACAMTSPSTMVRMSQREHFDRHGGNPGTDLLGEGDTLLNGLGREIRPIGRDQDVLEQCGSPPVCGSVDGKIAENHGWVDRGDYTASSPALSSRVGEPHSHR